eukprot:1057310-Rhodomonas_salina.1
MWAELRRRERIQATAYLVKIRLVRCWISFDSASCEINLYLAYDNASPGLSANASDWSVLPGYGYKRARSQYSAVC